MKEVNLNSVNSALAAQRTSRAAATAAKPEVSLLVPTDSVETNTAPLPDFRKTEQDLEARYALQRARLQSQVDSNQYPPQEVIDRLARLLAAQTEPFKKG